MFRKIGNLFSGDPLSMVERMARGMDSVGLSMGADASRIAETEETNGVPVPEIVRSFLTDFAELGPGLFDPSGHAQHSRALSRLLDSVGRDFDPLGVVGPGRQDVDEGREWWYFLFEAKPGVTRFAVWDDRLALRASGGEPVVEAAEHRHGIRFPDSFRHLTSCLDQVLHNSLHLHEGTVGAEPGACTEGFEGEQAYMRLWVEAGEEFSDMTVQEIEDYVPFYAGPYGDLHLFSKHRPGPPFLFSHETCGVSETEYADFDAFFNALMDGSLQFQTPY